MDLHYYNNIKKLNGYPNTKDWVARMMTIKAIDDMHNEQSKWMLEGVKFGHEMMAKIPSAPIVTIRKAYYGFEEVHDQLIEHMEFGKREIAATNDWFGDNAPGLNKSLTIQYTI
jgi:hypothetical protein